MANIGGANIHSDGHLSDHADRATSQADLFIDSLKIEIADSFQDTGSDKGVIDTYFQALTGKEFDEAISSPFDDCVYDVLLICEPYGHLEKSVIKQRIAELKEYGNTNAFTTLFAASKVAEIFLLRPDLSKKDRSDLEEVGNDLRKQLHQLIKDNPELVQSIHRNNLKLSEATIDNPEIKAKIEEVKNKKAEESSASIHVPANNNLPLSLFFLALFVGQAAGAVLLMNPPNISAPLLVQESDDLCVTNPQFCEGNLGIGRAQMPQLEGNVAEAFKEYWKTKNITVTEGRMPAAQLIPTQGELLASKVNEMVTNFRLGKTAPCATPIIVAEKGQVFDGHHRWAACKILKEDIKTVFIGAPIEDLLQVAHGFEGVEHHNLGDPSKTMPSIKSPSHHII